MQLVSTRRSAALILPPSDFPGLGFIRSLASSATKWSEPFYNIDSPDNSTPRERGESYHFLSWRKKFWVINLSWRERKASLSSFSHLSLFNVGEKKSFVSKKREREDFFASLEGPRLRFLNNGLLRLGRFLDEIIIELKNLTWNRLIRKSVSQPLKKIYFKFWSVNFTKFTAYKGPTELNGRHSDQSVIPTQSLIILLHRIVIRRGSQTPKITPSCNFIR